MFALLADRPVTSTLEKAGRTRECAHTLLRLALRKLQRNRFNKYLRIATPYRSSYQISHFHDRSARQRASRDRGKFICDTFAHAKCIVRVRCFAFYVFNVAAR